MSIKSRGARCSCYFQSDWMDHACIYGIKYGWMGSLGLLSLYAVLVSGGMLADLTIDTVGEDGS